MATEKSRSKTNHRSVTDIDVSGELKKRIDQWSKANGDDAHPETLHRLLARGSRSGKRKVQRTKT